MVAAISALCCFALHYQWDSRILNISEVANEDDKEHPAESSVNSEQTEQIDKSGTVQVPNVVGKEQHEGIELLTKIDLQSEVWWTEENNIEVEQYYIISQSIPAGSEVHVGTLVKVDLSPNKP